jgi:hypothetical protein
VNETRIGLVPWDDLFGLKVPLSSLTQILIKIQAMIVAGGTYSASHVFLTLDPDPWPTVSGPFVSIHPGRHELISGQWSGAGAYLAGYHGEIRIRLADQCLLDPVDRDDFALLRTDAGLQDRAQQLVEYLTGEKSQATLEETGLVQGPLSPGAVSDPMNRKGDRRWRSITIGLGLDWTHFYNRGMN